MPTIEAIDEAALLGAAHNLSNVFHQAAEHHERRFGFGYEPRPDAPDNLEDLLLAWQVSQASGTPLPVSSLHCESTIYGTVETNHALRFVHDVNHVLYFLDFVLHDELELARRHLELLRGLGFLPGSLEYRIVEADFVGQAQCAHRVGHFPENQALFVRRCLVLGAEAAISLEAGSKLPAVAA